VVYASYFFNESVISMPKYLLAPPMETYYIPDDCRDLESYRRLVGSWPKADGDMAEAFGQHANADIASQNAQTQTLLSTLLSLQPRIVQHGGKTRDQVVLETCERLLTQFASVEIRWSKKHDGGEREKSPLLTVMAQEIDRYNSLLSVIRRSLVDLRNTINGVVLISTELQRVYESLFTGAVPELWQQAYPSLKSLGAWTRDLIDRVAQLRQWADVGIPKVFWLGGLTFPLGFLTALLQASAQHINVPIDSLAFDFVVQNLSEAVIQQPAKEGAFVKGLFLDGARWDQDQGALSEPLPGELTASMPIVWFKPVENRKKSGKGFYPCPLYLYPIRSGTVENPSFVIEVDLKCGNHDQAFWTKRGTALLLSKQES